MKKTLIVALVLIQVVMFSAFGVGPMVGMDQLKEKAAQGIPGAQVQLGWDYLAGNGVKKDDKMAVELFEKASAQGNTHATALLGSCYARGVGVEQDYNKAMKLCKQAASQGDIVAKSCLVDIQNAIATHQAELGKKVTIAGHEVSPQAVDEMETPEIPALGQLENKIDKAGIKVKPASE
jgi:hypothetical protein